MASANDSPTIATLIDFVEDLGKWILRASYPIVENNGIFERRLSGPFIYNLEQYIDKTYSKMPPDEMLSVLMEKLNRPDMRGSGYWQTIIWVKISRHYLTCPLIELQYDLLENLNPYYDFDLKEIILKNLMIFNDEQSIFVISRHTEKVIANTKTRTCRHAVDALLKLATPHATAVLKRFAAMGKDTTIRSARSQIAAIKIKQSTYFQFD